MYDKHNKSIQTYETITVFYLYDMFNFIIYRTSLVFEKTKATLYYVQAGIR